MALFPVLGTPGKSDTLCEKVDRYGEVAYHNPTSVQETLITKTGIAATGQSSQSAAAAQ